MMRSSTIQFKTILVVILLIATTPLFAAKEKSGGKTRGEKRCPEARQQLRGYGNEERHRGGDFDGPAHGRGREIDRMHPQAEGLIPEAIKEKLNLTGKQKAQLAKIYKEQGEKIKKLFKELSELRQKLTETVIEEAKESEIRKIAKKMGSVIGNMAVIRSSGYAVLSDILTEEQFEIIAKFREKRGKGAENFQRRMKSYRKGRGEGREHGRRGEAGEHGRREGRGGGGEYGRREGRGGGGEYGRRGEGREHGRREGRGGGGEYGRRGEGGQPSPHTIFGKRDANDDGKLTPDEMGGKEKSKRFFDKFDANKDGVVTVKEFSRIVEQHPQKKGKKTKRERTNDDEDNDK